MRRRGWIGPMAQRVYQDFFGTWHWSAAGPRGIREGTADSYRDAWNAADAALAHVCRKSPRHSSTMPEADWIGA